MYKINRLLTKQHLILRTFSLNTKTNPKINPNPKSNSNLSIALPLLGGVTLLYLFTNYLGKTNSKIRDTNTKVELENKDDIHNKDFDKIDLSEKYDSLAATYDKSINLDEKLMFLGYLRKKLIVDNVEGDVLELSSGTGRNMLSYLKVEKSDPTKIKSITLVDKSIDMLNVSISKSETVELIEKFKKLRKSIKFYKEDCHQLTQLNEEGRKFDTVVQTFGLCSYQNPEQVLDQVFNLVKKDGKVLLLEHGLSKYDWLNNLLAKNSFKHAIKWGCIWNRDILNFIENSKFEIIECKRYHFGTTYMFILKAKH